jgi:hypothetical protein
MKTIYLIPIAALVFSCSNSKTITVDDIDQYPETTEKIVEKLQENINPEKKDSVLNELTNSIFIDSNLAVVWPIKNPWPYPNKVVIPYEIGDYGWWLQSTSIVWNLPDTLEDYQELPIQHMTSNKNCYSLETNEDGLLFTMDVVEAETLECRLSQFGDCLSHLPLNVSWVNAPLKMEKGSRQIQFNYAKHYELELLFKLKSSYNSQDIIMLS